MRGYDEYNHFHNTLFDQCSPINVTNTTIGVEDTLQQRIHRLEAVINLSDTAAETALETTLELYKVKVNGLKTEIRRAHHELNKTKQETENSHQTIKKLEHALDIEQTKTSNALDEVCRLKVALKKSEQTVEKEKEKRRQSVEQLKSTMKSMKDDLQDMEEKLNKEKQWKNMVMEWLQSELKSADGLLHMYCNNSHKKSRK